MNAQVRARVVADVDVRTTFDALVDLASQSRWMVGTSIYPIAGDIPVPQVGARMAAFTGVLGIGVLDNMEVTVYEPPYRWEVRHLGRIISGRGIFTVADHPDGSSVEWIEDLDLPLGILGKVGWPLIRPSVRWGLQRSLQRLAAGLATGAFPIGTPEQ